METFWCHSLRAETLQNLPTDQYDRLTDTDLRSVFIDHTGIILVMRPGGRPAGNSASGLHCY